MYPLCTRCCGVALDPEGYYLLDPPTTTYISLFQPKKGIRHLSLSFFNTIQGISLPKWKEQKEDGKDPVWNNLGVGWWRTLATAHRGVGGGGWITWVLNKDICGIVIRTWSWTKVSKMLELTWAGQHVLITLAKGGIKRWRGNVSSKSVCLGNKCRSENLTFVILFCIYTRCFLGKVNPWLKRKADV